MKKHTCKIVGCVRVVYAKGLCVMHYRRQRAGNNNLNPEPLSGPKKWKPDDPRYITRKDGCLIYGCNNPHYAKGFCVNHWSLMKRNGVPLKMSEIPKPKCSIYDCKKEATSHKSGYCLFHLQRKKNNIPLNRPKGVKGKNNPRWRGGIFLYPNHYMMKKNRLIVLE